LPEADVVQGRPGEILRASSVSRSFEGIRALQDVSLELRRHEVVGLIGPNGAGKSTLVNVLTGFDFPTGGTVELGERTITRWSAHRRARAGLTRTFQHSHAFRSLSVRENVEVAALGVGARPREARRRRAPPPRRSPGPKGCERHGCAGRFASDRCGPAGERSSA